MFFLSFFSFFLKFFFFFWVIYILFSGFIFRFIVVLGLSTEED